MNKPIKVTIRHSEYNGNLREEISYLNTTKYPEVKHIFKEKASQSNTGYAVKPEAFANNNSMPSYNAVSNIPMPDDDDLPF